MKAKLKTLLLILSVILSVRAIAQTKDSLKKELIGNWEFVELRSDENKKVDTIKHPNGIEIATGPLLTYRSDGTYSKQFTPQHTDNGKWFYDYEKKAIIQTLQYKKPYDFATKYMIDHGYAKKDQNGDYFETITDNVIELTNDKLILSEREGRQREFKKIDK